jgi:uncharacterized protein YbaR (Trm112 family)
VVYSRQRLHEEGNRLRWLAVVGGISNHCIRQQTIANHRKRLEQRAFGEKRDTQGRCQAGTPDTQALAREDGTRLFPIDAGIPILLPSS